MNQRLCTQFAGVLGALSVTVGMAVFGIAQAAEPDNGAAAQKIYLGSGPNDESSKKDSQENAQAQSGARDRDDKPRAPADTKHGDARESGQHGARTWKTPDGVQMFTPDPDTAPKEHVIRCPDGHIQSANSKAVHNAKARNKLCNAEDR